MTKITHKLSCVNMGDAIAIVIAVVVGFAVSQITGVLYRKKRRQKGCDDSAEATNKSNKEI